MKNFFKRLSLKFKAMDSLTKIFFLLFVVLALVTGVVAFNSVRNLTSSMTILDLPGAPVLQNLVNHNGTEEPSSGINQSAAVSTPEPWDGSSRVTILLLGLDYDDWRAGDTPHSDTMMLLTIDPVNKTAAMMSLPRDLWVNIPGFDYGRINESYFDGAAYNLPGGGPELARQTVEQFIGVPISYYVVIDFNAFIKLIDEVGGVEVVPDQNVVVEKFGGGEEQTLIAGQKYVLDGALTLAYARERHTEGGDVDRARRQQQVILAFRKRILKYQDLPTFIGKIPAIYADLSSGISTNMSIDDAVKLGVLALSLDVHNIDRAVIDYDMVIQATSPQGEAILKPIPDKIRALRDEVFTGGGTIAPMAVASADSSLVKDEAAGVVIWNGSGDSALGNRTADYLRSQGVNVIQVADVDYSPATRIEIFKGKPYTVNYLATLMGVANANIWNSYDPSAGADVRVTLGGDWAANNTLP
ncbi:MAG: polyisoprenyl-teichoic acid--peptidoglycan teichoic acid transferase [Chloroflexota bacterium]|nr:polyisoprenyl-teichoic acid--peptidoglycan teichoic acid transferase [Chloroflexota bacterium]